MSEGFDMEGLLQQAMAMQQQIAAAQQQAAAQSVEGAAGSGAVRITLTGDGSVTSVKLAAEVVDAADVELLEDLIRAAFADAQAKVAALQQQAMGPLAGGLGGLGGMLGA